MIELRPYQHDVIAEFHRTVAAGHKRIIQVAPTGAGKTIIGADIVNAVLRAKLDAAVLVLAHRREIITQTCTKLLKAGISHGVIQAGCRPRPLERVQVASIQTLWVRAMHRGSMDLPPAALVWVDECQHAPAKTYRKIIAAYPDAIVLGTTATPCRGNGRGLGEIFQHMIETPQVAELIRQGYLVGTRVYAPVDVDPILRGVRTVAGDYVESQLDERMNCDALVGDIVTHWHKFGERRKTIAFAVSVAHSIHIRDEFIKSGVRAEHIGGATPKLERDATLARLERGEIDLVANCMVLTEGWDMPAIGICRSARRAPSRPWTASWAWSAAIATPTARPTIRPSASSGTRCSSTSPASAAISPAGPHKYKDKFDTWPPWVAPQPIPPSPEVRSWVRSRDIAYAKRRRVAS